MYFITVHTLFFFFLAAPGLSCSTWDFQCGMWTFSCSMWDLVPWPGIKPRPPALGAQSVNHWTIREVPSSVANVVQLLSCIQLFVTPWTAAWQASLSFTISRSLLKLMSIEVMMPSNHLVLCHPLLLPSIFPSIRIFSNESALCIRWPKHWSFSISSSNEYSGLISFRIDWFHLAVQGPLKSLLQHQGSKASILWCSAFFMVQLSHLYMTTGETIALTIQTFVRKMMSLLFSMLCMLVTALSQYILLIAFHLQVSSSMRWRWGPFCHCLPIIKICWVHWGCIMSILLVRELRLREVKSPAIKWRSQELSLELIQGLVLSIYGPLLPQGAHREGVSDGKGVQEANLVEGVGLWRSD